MKNKMKLFCVTALSLFALGSAQAFAEEGKTNTSSNTVDQALTTDNKEKDSNTTVIKTEEKKVEEAPKVETPKVEETKPQEQPKPEKLPDTGFSVSGLGIGALAGFGGLALVSQLAKREKSE